MHVYRGSWENTERCKEGDKNQIGVTFWVFLFLTILFLGLHDTMDFSHPPCPTPTSSLLSLFLLV